MPDLIVPFLVVLSCRIKGGEAGGGGEKGHPKVRKLHEINCSVFIERQLLHRTQSEDL